MSSIAVLTGDLIGSTRVASARAFRGRMNELLNLIAKKYGGHTHVYRGDGFQIVLAQNVNAFQVALLFRFGLIAKSPSRSERWDARLAIAFGAGSLASKSENGAVFVESGRVLDAMKKEHLAVAANSEIRQLAYGAATRYTDTAINRLSAKEAEVLFYYFLDHESHQSIANKLHKQRATVTQALLRADYSLLDHYVQDMDALTRLLGHE